MIVGWARSTVTLRKSSPRQEPTDIIRVGESEWAGEVGGLRRRRSQMTERDVVGDQPMPVLLERRPARENEATTRFQRAAYVAKGLRWIGKEHDAHARGREVEGGRLELKHLSVPEQQFDIVQPALLDPLARDPEHRLGEVDRHEATVIADRRGQRHS